MPICPRNGTLDTGKTLPKSLYYAFYALYAFYAWWIDFPQSGALAEGTTRPVSHYSSLYIIGYVHMYMCHVRVQKHSMWALFGKIHMIGFSISSRVTKHAAYPLYHGHSHMHTFLSACLFSLKEDDTRKLTLGQTRECMVCEVGDLIGYRSYPVCQRHGHGHGHGIFILATHPEGI
jgi:hypothetical protein